MTILTNTVELARSIWDHTLGRLALIAVAAGWVPFYLLSAATAALTS